MWEMDCGCVPVIEENGRVAGILTDRDICMSTYFQAKRPQDILVRDVMSRQVLACRPEDKLGDVVKTMRRAQVRRLPVTDAAGVLLGILSLNDIAIEAERGKNDRTRADVRLDEVGLTLSAVGQHRAAAPIDGPPA
jgi:predicted transcriptional regulator